jgi:hypothetical protein
MENPKRLILLGGGLLSTSLGPEFGPLRGRDPGDHGEIPIYEAEAENIFDLELLEDQVVQFGLEAGKFRAICLNLSRFRDNSTPQLSLLLV